MARQAYDARLYDRIKPKIGQMEATTGRRISSQQLEALMTSELQVEAGRADESRKMDLREKALDSSIDFQNRQLDIEEDAAKAGGAMDLLGAGLTYSMYDKMFPSKAAAAAKGGAQTAFATTAAGGAQTVSALGTETLTGTAADFAAESFVPAAGGEAAAGLAYGPAALAGTAGKIGAGILGANQEFSNVAGGAVAGGILGASAGGSFGATLGSAAGPVGAVIGGIVGLGIGELVDSVICTELLRTGHMDAHVHKAAALYTHRCIPNDVYLGYRILAGPLVERMKGSKAVAFLVRPFGKGMAQELAHLWKPEKFKGSILGKIVLAIGMPICSKTYNRTENFVVGRGTI